MMGGKVRALAVEPEDVAELSGAELRCALRDRVEHRLDVRRRLADDPESGCRGLLLERLGELAIALFDSLKVARSDRDRGLIPKVVTSSICLSVKGSTRVFQRMTPSNTSSSASERRASSKAPAVGLRPLVSRLLQHVMPVNRPALSGDSK
jgi:hypothetical protein